MASALDRFFAADAGSAPARDLKTVVSYRVDVKRDSKGNPGLSIRPVLADGSEGRFGDMWIRLAEGPGALRAFAASLPAIQAHIAKLDQYMVASGEWKAAPGAAAPAAPKPPTKPAAKPAAAQVAAPAPAKSADIFDDLPF